MTNDSVHDAVRAEISRRLTAAVKGRDQTAVSALRAALSALDNATAVPLAGVRPAHYGGPTEVPRRQLTRADVATVLAAETERRFAAAAEYERLGHPDQAARLRREAAIIHGTLEHLAGSGEHS